jgi:RNA polymerase sigma factor (sigma-70 family)
VEITSEILNACKRDDRRAIQALYIHCFKSLMPVCFRYHHNEEDARAALNLGFMKVLKGLDALEGEVNFNAWSKRIMVNCLIDEYRRSKKHNEHLSYKETDRELEFTDSSTLNEGEGTIGYENLLALIRELPPVSAQVFNFYVIDGYNHKEIGELLGISEGTSKWHLSTARKILRDKLDKLESLQTKMVI